MATRKTPIKDEEGRALALPEALLKLGAKVTPDKLGITIPVEAIDTLRANRIRTTSMAQVPSTPRMVWRNGGGVGVQKGMFRWDSLAVESLRRVRERSPLVQAIHRARQTQVQRLARQWPGKRGEVGWRIVHKDFHDPNKKVPDSIKPYIATAEKLIKVPHPLYCPTTGSMFSQLEDDYLTLNRPVIERIYSTMDSSYVVGFRPVDAGIIWPTLNFMQKWFAEHPRWYGDYDVRRLTEEDALNIMSDSLGHDIAHAEYCLVREGVLEAVYGPGVLKVAPALNRTDITYAGWPPSHVEQGIEAILSFWNTWTYNASYHTRGMLAEFIIGVSGNVADEDLDAFRDMLRQATQGADRAWQPPIMPLPDAQTLQVIQLKPNNRDMCFETWLSLLISLVCAYYRMDPSTINAKPWDGGSGPSLSAPNREKEIALAKEEGLQSDMQHLVDAMFDPLVQEIHPDLRMVFEYGDFDPLKEAQINEILVRTTKSRNEIRMSQGDDPWGFFLAPPDYKAASDEDKKKHDDNPWNMPADPGFMNAMNQRKMMEQMQNQQQPDGFGGNAGDAKDDGFGGEQPQFPFGKPPGAGGGPPGAPGAPGAAPKPPAAGAAPPMAAAPAPKPQTGTAPLMKGGARLIVRSDGTSEMHVSPPEQAPKSVSVYVRSDKAKE